MGFPRTAAPALLALAIALAPAARAAEEPAPKPPAPAADDAKARKVAKVQKFLELSRWDEQVMTGMDAAFEQQVKLGALPADFAAKFHKAADMKALKVIAVDIFMELYDEEVLDGLVAFLETGAGKKYAQSNLRAMAVVQDKIGPWAMETAMKAMGQGGAAGDEGDEGGMEVDEGDEGEEAGKEEGDEGMSPLQAAKRSANETGAIATLRNLASCQAQIQTSGKIDADEDGIGEYGTFLEMSGAVGVRKSSSAGTEGNWISTDFSRPGSPVNPPIISSKMKDVGADGIVKKNGYCYRIFLPDSAKQSGFVHETGPADKVGLAGGNGKVGVDMSETTWCAYAWPEKAGETGRRVFFVDQSGDVLYSANTVAQCSGEKGPVGIAAFRGAGITSRLAIGTAGRDGDVWKVTN